MDIKTIIENLKQKDNKKIQKILFIMITINLLMVIIAISTNLFSINKIIRTIINCLMGIVNIILVVFIIKPEEILTENGEIDIETKYDPILLKFFYKSQVDASPNLLISECLSLGERNLLEINKKENDCIFTLKGENFIRMNGVETLEEEQIDQYSKNGIPAYENLYVTKILFPFENSVSLKDMLKKSKEGYYQSRIEMCELLLEKMILHELERENIIKGDKSKIFPIVLIINIIVAVLSLFGLGMFNIVLLLGTLVNIAVSGILFKNENVFAYNFTLEISDYIDSAVRYARQMNIMDEPMDKQKLILKILFSNMQINNDIINVL